MFRPNNLTKTIGVRCTEKMHSDLARYKIDACGLCREMLADEISKAKKEAQKANGGNP